MAGSIYSLFILLCAAGVKPTAYFLSYVYFALDTSALKRYTSIHELKGSFLCVRHFGGAKQ